MWSLGRWGRGNERPGRKGEEWIRAENYKSEERAGGDRLW